MIRVIPVGALDIRLTALVHLSIALLPLRGFILLPPEDIDPDLLVEECSTLLEVTRGLPVWVHAEGHLIGLTTTNPFVIPTLSEALQIRIYEGRFSGWGHDVLNPQTQRP